MSKLSPDEPSIAPSRADSVRRTAAAQEARGAQTFALTLAPTATPVAVGASESQPLRVWRLQHSEPFIENPLGNRMKRACPPPSSTETLASWGSTPRRASRPARTRRARPPCQVNGRDLGDAMAQRRMASAYLRYSSKYMDAKVEARPAKRGVWQGDFVQPQEWRHRR
jgi:hypothetical protein